MAPPPFCCRALVITAVMVVTCGQFAGATPGADLNEDCNLGFRNPVYCKKNLFCNRSMIPMLEITYEFCETFRSQKIDDSGAEIRMELSNMVKNVQGEREENGTCAAFPTSGKYSRCDYTSTSSIKCDSSLFCQPLGTFEKGVGFCIGFPSKGIFSLCKNDESCGAGMVCKINSEFNENKLCYLDFGVFDPDNFQTYGCQGNDCNITHHFSYGDYDYYGELGE